MNLELRKEILEQSLIIENKLSEILLVLLGIRKDNPKTLGYQGSSLSFKSKTDLLFDINVISKNLYNDLVTFMEIRNQFIHNLDALNFKTVLQRIGRNKNFTKEIGEKFKYDDYKEEEAENRCKDGFKLLSIKVCKELIECEQKILQEKLKEMEQRDKLKEVEYSEKIYNGLIEDISNAIDDFAEHYGNHLNEGFNTNLDWKGQIKRGIQGFTKLRVEKRFGEMKSKSEIEKENS